MRKLGLRIILGYLLLTATLCAAVWFIVRSARAVSEVSGAARVVAMQRKAANNLVAKLFESGTMAENATLQYASNRAARRYLQSVEKADTALRHLARLTVNRQQLAKLDTLSELIYLKSEGVMDLIRTLRQENHRGSELQQQIEELRSGRKPIEVGTQVSVPVVEHGEEVVIQRRKKGFFHRLGDAFRKAKDDTVMISTSTSTREAVADSAVASVNISDTIADILSNVHEDLTRGTLDRRQKVSRKSDRLRASSIELSRRITLLLEDITEGQQKLMAAASQQESEKRRQAAWQMGAVALAGTLAALLLFVWVWRDMSRANRYRIALEEAKAQAEDLMKRREQLLLTISHDIKAPVNTVLGYLSLLKPQTPPAAERELTAIDSAAHHLLDLVTALLDYHKLEAGGLSVKLAPAALHHLFSQIARAFEPLAEAKGISLLTNLNIPPDVIAETDAFRLRQIVENLLSNAIKYTQKGEVELSARIGTDSLHVAVRDTGCGLSRYDCERIFEPFTRVKGSEGQEGTGLGLSITQKLAGLLGGSLSVKSEMAVGSTFTLTLDNLQLRRQTDPAPEEGMHPLATDSDQSTPMVLPTGNDDTASTVSAESESESETQAAQTIAVLDDDQLQIRLTEAMLRNVLPADTVICLFTAADELFAWLAEGERPDAVFTDIEMPGVTGYEVLAQSRKITGDDVLPVIATTSHSLIPAEEFRQRGFTDVLFKPFTQNDLRRVVPPAKAVPLQTTGEETVAETSSPFAPLLLFADGDADAEREILTQFRKDCETHRELFGEAYRTHDKETVCRLAHKMLPTFTLIQSPAATAMKLLEDRRSETVWTPDDDEPAQTISRALDETIRWLKRIKV